MVIKWVEDFNTGIEEIDIHHVGLFDKINELLDAIEHGVELTSIRKLTIFFESFLMSHFTLEEVLQQRLGYPDYESHCEQHEQLRKDFSGLMKLIDTEGASPHFVSDARDLINNCLKSYISHINSEDRKLAEFLKSRW